MNQESIDRGLEELRTLVHEDADLRSEFSHSRREFFRSGDASGDSEADRMAARRHLEWFLLERESERLGSIPAEVLLERAEARSAKLSVEEAQPFLGSHCGMFEVTGVTPGEGLWLRDLVGHGEYAVVEREASQLLRSGDLIVGRLFPVGDSLHHISRAASFFRNPHLLEALRRDLESARAARRGVLRLSQREIESMFYASSRPASAGDAIGEARQLLVEGGLGREEVDEILEALASETFASGAVLLGSHDVLGDVLDRLALESTIDLDTARRALVAAWAELSHSGPGVGVSLPIASEADPSSGAPSIAEAVAAYENRLKSGESIDRALSDLELALARAGESIGADEEETPAPDFPGVVGAMIEEFLWEAERELGAQRAQELHCLRSFGRFASSVGVFENLSAEELSDYACRWLPESDELGNADEARRLLAALQRFCRWSEENHEVPLHSEFKAALRALQESLPRVTEANRRRTRISDTNRGAHYEFLSADPPSLARIRDESGHEREVKIDPEMSAWLRPGDRLRGHVLGDGRLATYCCYPGKSGIEPTAD
jgi:hypothetical protein